MTSTRGFRARTASPHRRTLRGALRDERGVTAVLFALAIAVLAPLAFGALDIYVAGEQRGKLQDALDAAALYAARSTAQTNEQLDPLGDRVLLANLKMIDGAVLQSSTFSLEGPTVVATASVTLAALYPMPWNQHPVSVRSEVKRAMDKLEIALVLDNTGSMVLNGSTKLATLKTEAKKLVDKLALAAQRSAEPTPIKIALVPFSNTVRVQGTTSLTGYNSVSHTGPGIPAWLDPRGRMHGAYDIFAVSDTDRFQMMRNVGQSWSGCVESRRQPQDIQETAPTSGDNATLFTPYFWPDEPDTSGANFLNSYLPDGAPNGSTWQQRQKRVEKYAGGSINSGTFTFLGMNYAKGPNAGCTLQPLVPLTSDTASIKTAIDAMNAVGETNVPLGLMWGWHALSPNAPIATGASYTTPHLRKIVILMTDGENTFYDSENANDSAYSGLGYIWQQVLGLGGSSTLAERTAAMNARLNALCTNMKARNIEIYTIGLEVQASSRTLLRNCASSPEKSFDVTSSGLGGAFDAIAGAIANLRISK
jgi:Flp pilus assembly protein TadG